MKLTAETNYINRILPSRRIPTSDNTSVQLEKTQDVTHFLKDNRPLSSNNKTQQTVYNTINGASMLQVANESLNEIRGGLQELKNISLKVNDPQQTLSPDEINQIQDHAEDIVAGIQDLLESTKFNGESLLTENTNHTLVTNSEMENAVNVVTYDVANELGSTGLYSININHPETIANAIKSIDDSVDIVDFVSDKYDAQQNNFNESLSKILNYQSFPAMEESKNAQAISNTIVNSLQITPMESMQTQANISPERGLNLLTK